MTTAPSRSATIRSSGKTATPPQATGCCQPTKVRPATEGGAAVPRAQTGEAGGEHAVEVADDAVGDEGGDAAPGHAGAEDVAEDAGVDDAHGVDDGDGAFGHRLDRGAGRGRGGPGGGGGEVLAGGDEAQGEGGADDARLVGREREGAAQPDVAQAALEQDGGEGGGGDAGECGRRRVESIRGRHGLLRGRDVSLGHSTGAGVMRAPGD